MTRKPRRERQEPTVIDSMQLAVGQKIIYVDLLENHRGIYVRVNEVYNGERSMVVLPEEMLAELGKTFTGYAAKIKEHREPRVERTDSLGAVAALSQEMQAEVAESDEHDVPTGDEIPTTDAELASGDDPAEVEEVHAAATAAM